MHSDTKNSPWRDVTVFKNTKKKVCYIKTMDEYVTVFDDFFLHFFIVIHRLSRPTITLDSRPPLP